MKDKDMKNKKYTKRQILESIKYWKKQLKFGNYKKVNETIDKQEKFLMVRTVSSSYNRGDWYPYEITNENDCKSRIYKIIKNVIKDYDNSYIIPFISTEITTDGHYKIMRHDSPNWIKLTELTSSDINKITDNIIDILKTKKTATISISEEFGIEFYIGKMY